MWNPGVLGRDRRREGGTAFDLESRSRTMNVVLDGRQNPSDPQVAFLLELLSMPEFRCFRPADAEELKVGWPFRLELPNVTGFRGVRVDRGAEGHSSHALWANGWTEDPSLIGLDRAVPVADAQLPAALTDIARSLSADLVVGQPRLRSDSGSAPGAVAPNQALALIGLHMRAHGRHIWWANGASSMSSDLRWASWMEAARALHPVWSTKLAQPPEASTGNYLQACIERIRRLLRVRDEAMLSKLVVSDAPHYDGVEALEAGALTSMAALDALARAVNSALDLGISPHRLNWWSDKPLMEALRQLQPAAFELVADDLSLAYLKVLGALRNTIHSEPLTPALLERRPGKSESVAKLPGDVSDLLGERLELLGLTDTWRAVPASEILLDPAQVLHDVTLWTAEMANAICTRVTWPNAGSAPPLQVADPNSPRSEVNFARNRWLYGLDVWATQPPDTWRPQAI